MASGGHRTHSNKDKHLPYEQRRLPSASEVLWPCLATHRACQRLLLDLFPFCSTVVLQGKNPYDSLREHKKYLIHLFDSQHEYSENDKDDFKCKDQLQSPLQPLMNDLEASCYEGFEQDSTKYVQYRQALVLALEDYKQHGRFVNQQQHQPPIRIETTSNNVSMIRNEVRILIVGAGRGPLISCAFEASRTVNIKITVTAIEKNHNALIALRNLVHTAPWGSYLTIVQP